MKCNFVEKRVKKSIIAFVAAFGLSIGLIFLSLAVRIALSNSSLFNNAVDFQTVFTLANLFLSLGGFALFFAVFYVLAKRNKIKAEKATCLVTLFGVILGSLIPYLFSIVTYLTNIVLYLSLVAGSLVSSFFQFFLPALIALLFVELKEKTVKDSFSTSNGVSAEGDNTQSSTSAV
jgi:uncharacterized protein YacL